MSRAQPQRGLARMKGMLVLGHLCSALGLWAANGAAPCLALRGAGGLGAFSSPCRSWVLLGWGRSHCLGAPVSRGCAEHPRRRSERGCKGHRGSGPRHCGLAGPKGLGRVW